MTPNALLEPTPTVRATSDQSPNPEERAAARRHAVEIARLLDSGAVSYRRITIGEPQCSYRVPFHAEDFWFKVLLSDKDFVFTGEHRRRDAFTVPFCAALQQSWRNMGATTHLPRVSDELGVAVYAPERFTETAISVHLLTPGVAALVRRLDFAPISLLFVNSIQITVTSRLISPEHCAQQVRLLRTLLLTIFHEAHDTNAA
jgi:hypothetical protein